MFSSETMTPKKLGYSLKKIKSKTPGTFNNKF